MPIKYKDDIREAYLDNEKKYYDYGTAAYSGDGNVIDLNHTGMSFYDQFLGTSELDYLRDKKNLKGTVVKMTPKEYYQNCAYKIFNTSTERLKRERGEYDRPIIEKLKNVVNVYKRKLCMPMINYADKSQEGLHRMLAIAELFGWEHKVPVLVIDWYDEERAENEKREANKAEIDRKVKKAISKTLEYRFVDKEDFEIQLQAELDRAFEFDDVDVPETINLSEAPDFLILKFNNYEYPIDKEDIKIVDPVNIDEKDQDTDDFDVEEAKDFLKKYFGDDLTGTFPNLEEKFKILKRNLN